MPACFITVRYPPGTFTPEQEASLLAQVTSVYGGQISTDLSARPQPGMTEVTFRFPSVPTVWNSRDVLRAQYPEVEAFIITTP